MRRDREDELDFAHIRGEVDATTHAPTLAQPRRRPKRRRVIKVELLKAAMAKIVLTQSAGLNLHGDLPCISFGPSSSGSSQV